MFFFLLSLQIRAEQPYYSADNEVDSLVSIRSYATAVDLANEPKCFGFANVQFELQFQFQFQFA